MSTKDSSAKHYQNNKKGYIQKKLFKGIEVVVRKKKKTSNNMVVNDTKIYQKVKNKREKKRERTLS